jgi:uncharacterized FAD-dependent dehydrogenase
MTHHPITYRLSGIKLTLDETWEALPRHIEKACALSSGTIGPNDFTVLRESIDARNKKAIRLVYTIDFTLPFVLKGRAAKKVQIVKPEAKVILRPGSQPVNGVPVVVGFGPCGIFAALRLAEAGYAPIVIERGRPIEQRVSDVAAFWQQGRLDPESNVLFGEGGAGTFSDGKLTTGIRDPHIRQVLETFAAAGAPEDILYKQKPHIGTDILRRVVVTLHRHIEAAGGRVLFDTCLTDLNLKDGSLAGITLKDQEAVFTLETNCLILAPGHSARDTFRRFAAQGLTMAQKPFSIGLRVEHPQSLIDHAQYGDEDRLPPATYKLSTHTSNGRGVYSFCMCPGGQVITATTQKGLVCVNGMSEHRRDSGTANAGILVDVRCSDFDSPDVLAGIAFQERYEAQAFRLGGSDFTPPRCSWADFINENPEGRRVSDCLPEFAAASLTEAIPHFGRQLRGFDCDDARLTAVETRSSSPVRILRDDDLMSSIPGLFPAGEGAGYAGGITSAACDGLRAAEAVIARYQQPNASS